MGHQTKRAKRIFELYTRLLDVAKLDPRLGISSEKWRQILARFQLDIGLSSETVNDYLWTLRGIGVIYDNWTYAIKNAPYELEEFERLFRYFINPSIKVPTDIKE